jgi:hypothetical protein
MDPISTIRANIAIPALRTKSTTLLLLPDLILVVRAREIWAVPWTEVEVTSATCKFAEDHGVPLDAEVVG